MKESMPHKNNFLGAHISIADGLDKAFNRATQATANCMQIFTKSNRQWQTKPLAQEEIHAFKQAWKDSEITAIVAHAAYLINLGSSNLDTEKKSIDALAHELQRCEQLGIPYLVVHPGTAHFADEEQSLQFTAKNIDRALEQSQTKQVMLLLENMAGQGKTIGSTFRQLGQIIHYSKEKKHLGICFDTCHAFAAGYQFDTPQGYKNMWHEFDQEIGLNKLKIFHINDSKNTAGSHVDRHEHIGKGSIPLAAFSLILDDKKFQTIPKIIETPKSESDLLADQKNLNTLRSLVFKSKK